MRAVFAVSAVSAVSAVLVAAAAFAADPAPPPPKPPKPTPELLTQGRAVFEVSCASCHGSTGDGAGPAGQFLNPKPRHFTKDLFKQGDGVAQIFTTLQTGVPQTAMVPFAHLSEEDRWALAWYVSHWRPTKEGKQTKKLVDKLPPLAPPTAAAPAAAP